MIALAPVSAGWTGSIAITVGAATVTVTPALEQSAASIVLELLRLAALDLGGVWAVTAPAGVLTITGQGTWDLTVSGTTATRLALTSASGVSSVTASGAYAGAVHPAGLSAGMPDVGVEVGRSAGSGALAAAPVLSASSVSLSAYESTADAWALEEVAGVHDLWDPDRQLLLARVWIMGWERQRRAGSLVQARLSARAEVVR